MTFNLDENNTNTIIQDFILGYSNIVPNGYEEFIKKYKPPPYPIPLYKQNWNNNINSHTEFSFRPYQTFFEFNDEHYLNNKIYNGHGILKDTNILTQLYIKKNKINNTSLLQSYNKDYDILANKK
jgi:hypothetical protein